MRHELEWVVRVHPQWALMSSQREVGYSGCVFILIEFDNVMAL